MATEYVGMAIAGLIIQYIIIYFAVHNGTDGTRKLLKQQNNLLENLARKSGATEQEIDNAKNV